MSQRSPAFERLFLLLFAPLIIAWGAGTTDPWLDLAGVPGAFLASIPSRLPWAGTIACLAIALWGLRDPEGSPGRWTRGAAQVVALPLLASLAALGRPLPWIAAGFLAAAWWRRADAAIASDAPTRWEIAALPGLWWILARIHPFGDGVLPPHVEDAVALALGDSPRIADGLALLLPLAAAPLLAGPTRPGAGSIALGAGAALLLVATFGSDQAWISAAILGGVIGAFPPRTARDGGRSRQLLALGLVCVCAAGRLTLTERWRCADAAEEAWVKRLLEAPDVTSLGLSAGNLGYLALIADEGRRLQRMTVTGALGDSAPLDPAGGSLVSPLAPGGPVARVVPTEQGAFVQWWDVPRLQEVARRDVALPCPAEDALDDGAGNLLIACGERTFRVSDDDDPVEVELTGLRAREALNRGILASSTGPLARAALLGIEGPIATTHLGPYAGDIASAPGRFLVARGPAGHLELRAAPPAVPSLHAPATTADDKAREALRRRSDSVRVGSWPSSVRYSPRRAAAYVASSVDAAVTLVDLDVTWQQRAVSVGAPPRQVVLEAGSATLYVANRCGVFAVRIPRPDPWE